MWLAERAILTAQNESLQTLNRAVTSVVPEFLALYYKAGNAKNADKIKILILNRGFKFNRCCSFPSQS